MKRHRKKLFKGLELPKVMLRAVRNCKSDLPVFSGDKRGEQKRDYLGQLNPHYLIQQINDALELVRSLKMN